MRFPSPFGACLKLAETMIDILRKVPAGVSLAQVAAQARMNASYLYRIKCDGKQLSPATAQRLHLAIAQLRSSELEGVSATNALYRSLLIVAALELKLDPLEVQLTDPRAKRTNNPQWLACVQAHWLARWVMNQVFGITQSAVARAMGVTKQAVNQSMQAIFERQETDASFDAMLDQLREKLIGVA
jgi:transcriptional regulator with XRE-family HTH domain